MSDPSAHRTPFVLGKPIKNPADFYGRKAILRELFDAALSAELVAVVGEHRCGNTSIIYQMLHPDVRQEYLSTAEDHGMVLVLVSSQLAAGGPDALFRRIARTLRRSDPEATASFDGPVDHVWMEDYLEDLADRHRRLVLLVDEFEVLAGFEPEFWEWFEKLVTRFDVAVVVTARVDLGEFRTERGSGPPFFNMFRSVYVGSFLPETVDHFLQEKSEITDFDFLAVRDLIEELAGRFPYYMQVASALCYLYAGGEAHITDEEASMVRKEFTVRTAALFDDAWTKLPQIERDALTWLVLGAEPEGEDVPPFHAALQSLERRAYVLDGRIFSSVFAEFVRAHIGRVSLNYDTGKVRVGSRLLVLLPKPLALLRFLLDHEDQVTTRHQIAEAVWPEHGTGAQPVSEAMVEQVVAELAADIEDADSDDKHIEHIPGEGYRFVNHDV